MISKTQTSHLDPIGTFLAMEIYSKAQQLSGQGRDIIHLEFGEPDFSAPTEAVESVQKSMKKNSAGYTFSQGLEELTYEITQKYEMIMVSNNARASSVTNGSSLLLYIAIR